ncbi:MAG: NADH-quinone oxidoreductase subunit NuoF [Actinobacteria bacterium]|nr:NADH-quinone oxidoreductase subunit NuoF [Actinomycetota bacterium]
MKPDVRAQILDLAATYPTPQAALLSALQMVQEAEGGRLTTEDLSDVARLLDVPLGTVYATVSYYTMLNLEPVGKYHLQLDTNISAKLVGALDLLAHIEQALGISAGETTPDGLFTLSTVEDLGACGTCPVLQVNDRYYEKMTAERFDELLTSLKQGVMPDWKTEGNWGTECNILLARRGKPDSTALAGYVADGGYQALEKALTLSPAEIVQMVKDSGLRGRGGAGFPAGVKWSFLPKGSTKPVYLVCNADEGEPGTFKDRQIMEFDPHLLLEGMAVSGYAVGAKQGYIYIRGEFAWIADILERAVAEAREAGKLGNNILGRGVEFDVRVVRGAGAYVCGEETALIESLEGKRGNPRLRPPYPAASGVFGCPTIVNNVETLACVPYIVLEGAEAFSQIGTPNNTGPKLFGVSGHVNKPGVYEFPLGVPLAKILEAAGGVVGNLKAVIVGGLSTQILTADECRDLTMDYDTCAEYGTGLGSGGIIVMNDTVEIPEIALRTIEFYAHESCGQCTPCRQGSTTIKQMLKRVVDGKGSSEDLENVLQLCKTIMGNTLCPMGDAFSMPIEAMLLKYRAEFDSLLPDGSLVR